ncbi:MAG: transposase [bacterium]|nr:transposase [bacterium]
MYLPTYSPDLNPIERLWLYLTKHYFNNRHTQKYTIQ